jgi:cytochrome c biogenesis protein ResB
MEGLLAVYARKQPQIGKDDNNYFTNRKQLIRMHSFFQTAIDDQCIKHQTSQIIILNNGRLTMEIIEALNIVSDFIEGEYIYQDDEGEWWIKAEAMNAMQSLINQGMVQHLAEWYRDTIRQFIADGQLAPNPNDPLASMESVVPTH